MLHGATPVNRLFDFYQNRALCKYSASQASAPRYDGYNVPKMLCSWASDSGGKRLMERITDVRCDEPPRGMPQRLDHLG